MHTRFHPCGFDGLFSAVRIVCVLQVLSTCRAVVRHAHDAAQFPNFTYGSNIGVHDLRMYVGQALDSSQAWAGLTLGTGTETETKDMENWSGREIKQDA